MILTFPVLIVIIYNLCQILNNHKTLMKAEEHSVSRHSNFVRGITLSYLFK